MIRLPLSELEEALHNPSEYRRKLSSSSVVTYSSYSYFRALRDAIFKYHKPGTSDSDALAYLNDRLSRFRNPARIDNVIGQFEWYLKHQADCGLTTFQTRLSAEVPLPSRFKSTVICSGQVSRLDIQPSGGYAAWLFRSKDYHNWHAELRMPLTQLSVANKLNVTSEEVTIGVYSFEERFVEARRYSQAEIDSAYNQLDQLIIKLVF